ncbi:4Fe-4S dicluster domain-containing protein [Bacteroidota bacterium]
MALINPKISKEIQSYDAVDFSSCFSCGNCTAICELSEENAFFPRNLIRYGMLGMKDEILSSKEIWLCYGCGECSETCPRGSEPGDYVAALRRYAIAHYEPTGLTKLMFRKPLAFTGITLILAFLLFFILMSLKPDHEVARWIFNLLPFDAVHDLGMYVFLFLGIITIIGLVKMQIWIGKANSGKKNGNVKGLNKVWKALIQTGNEIVTMKRYRECDIQDDAYWAVKPWFLKPWFVHWTVMMGFLGLLLATILDFIFKDPATDIWLPSRILGTVTGLMMMYGASLAIVYRLLKPTHFYAKSRMADWIFLIFIWFSGFTGFWMEAAVTFHADSVFNQTVFIIHTVISMELVIMLVFSKFAHAVYRPVALFLHYLQEA